MDAIGYDAMQDRLGSLMHGTDDWQTQRVPKAVAAAGAWAQGRLEPVVPDAIDDGEQPFIRPFMVKMADDHYALDVSRAREVLGWEPQHRLADELPAMVDNLKSDPAAWYRRNGIQPPSWVEEAADIGLDVERLRARHERQLKAEHGANRWAHFVDIGLGSWLVTQSLLIGVPEPMLRIGEIACGLLLLMLCAGLALSWQLRWTRWLCAGIGCVVMALPFLISTTNGAAYLSDTLIGALIFGFAVCTKPEPGVSAIAALHGPALPPGWSYNPSNWTQRMPIIVLAVVGLYVSRYLAGYQLGYIPDVWDPFFVGNPADPKNGTEEIVTSFVSQAWPMSDAAVGGLHLPAGDRHRHRRFTPALAHHAVAGGAVRLDDRAAGHHLDLVHRDPADRHRHLEHDRADRHRVRADPDSLFARRVGGHAAVPAAPQACRAQPAAGVLLRRYRRDAEGPRAPGAKRNDRRRFRPAARRGGGRHGGRRGRLELGSGPGAVAWFFAALHAAAAGCGRQRGQCPSRRRRAGADGGVAGSGRSRSRAALRARAAGCGAVGGAVAVACRCGRCGLRGVHRIAADRRQPESRNDQATPRQLGTADSTIMRARPQEERI